MSPLDEMPAVLEGPPAWVGDAMAASPERWLTRLDEQQFDELQRAADTFLARDRDLATLSAADFPLPSVAKLLKALQTELIHGTGVRVLRGLPVQSQSEQLSATIFYGIGAHLGQARSQNAQGHVLGHVRDLGRSSSDPTTRLYQTAERQSFHTDSADVVGLLCLQQAREGGDSLLVSALSIYNRMRRLRPDLLALLFDPIATDRRGEIPPGEKPFLQIPVFNWHDGQLSVFYQRQYIDSAQRFSDAPRLTSRHVEALDLFDRLANDPELHFTMHLLPGDMQFVYNHTQLHDRTAFVDWDDAARRRHLLRLWLSIPGDRQLPEVYRERYGSIEAGNRGGIITGNGRLTAPLN